MKAAIFFMFLFNLCAVNAQLFISPSAKSDHYIYVRDRLFYVEKEIKLVENKSKETPSGIYLRKGSQMLQGEISKNENSGSGSLSVFQTGSSNAYDYNYWALPVHLNMNNPDLKDFIYEPIDRTESRNVRLVSSLEGSSDPLSISKRWIYTFSGNDYSDWHYQGDHLELLPGEGFTMK